MKWRRWLLVGGLVLVVAVVVGGVIATLREPHYGGESLTEWLQTYEQATDNVRRDTAASAVRHIGTNAIPYLMDWLCHGPPKWMARAPAYMGRLPSGFRNWWQNMLMARNKRTEGELGFAILGAMAVDATPELIRRLKNPDVDFGIGSALLWIGQPAIPPLMQALTNRANSDRHRGDVAMEIARFGTSADMTVPVLLDSLKGDRLVACCAAYALSQVAAEPATVVPALTNAAVSERAELRIAAIQSLATIAERKPSVVPLIRVALTDGDEEVRRFATNLLRGFYPEEFPGHW